MAIVVGYDRIQQRTKKDKKYEKDLTKNVEVLRGKFNFSCPKQNFDSISISQESPPSS